MKGGLLWPVATAAATKAARRSVRWPSLRRTGGYERLAYQQKQHQHQQRLLHASGPILPPHVRIVEVGPRDGLQNEVAMTTRDKVELIDRLSQSGLQTVEATSFVSPKWVPQLSDGAEVMSLITRQPSVTYQALVPNLKGFEAAVCSQVDEVSVFTSASEAFAQKNINCSIAESLERFEPLMVRARELGMPVRGYVSCVLGCPYQGEVSPQAVAEVTASLLAMGCYEVSLGDTIGVGTPGSTSRLLQHLIGRAGGGGGVGDTSEPPPTSPPSSSSSSVRLTFDVRQLAVHFHDTYGQALANILTALGHGVGVVDAAVGGLGGCPYAKGASGNVATEDVVYMLDGMGVNTGVDLAALVETSRFVEKALGRPTASRVARAMLTAG